MFSQTLFNASATMASSATATARRTWADAENSWLCPCRFRHWNTTTGNGGNNSPGTIHCSVRNAAAGRWYASPSFRPAAPSKNVTAHKLCSSLTHWVWPAPSVAYGRTTRVSPCQFSWFDNAQYAWKAVSAPLPHQQYRHPGRRFTTCHDQDPLSSLLARTLVTIQNT